MKIDKDVLYFTLRHIKSDLDKDKIDLVIQGLKCALSEAERQKGLSDFDNLNLSNQRTVER